MEIIAIVAVTGTVIFLVWVVASAIRRLVERVTVFEFERGLRYDRGRFTGVVGPGQYWLLRWRTTMRPIDVRLRVVTVPGQEVISADGVSVRVSLTAQYEIESPAVAINEHTDFAAAFYASLQNALRDIVGQGEIDDLIARRAEIGAKLGAATQGDAARLGLKLLSVEVKDFMFPGELKRVFAQVVSARKEGLAALERARGETAALRNLGNAARLMEGAPALLQLRLLQELGRTSGNTIVLGFPAGAAPLPLRSDPGAGEIESPMPEDQ